MHSFILVCHVSIAVVMVIVVLLQSGKGGGLGAGFGGGGANTLFGSSGGGNFFTKLTMGLAAAFMVTSLALTALRGKEMKSSIFDNGAASVPPAATDPAVPAADNSASAPATTPAANNAAPAAPAASEKPADKK